ncbi:Cytochrome P450 2J5 [Orchesella cincta]|uniref:Cytochrome P450 2J5 n=1 Tax=Orchesella cincta TaxID=48709 RepID=A0A1D2MNS7_ORCCI|nr:Cytochrome P450 2J5 [Orchesella cincta]
MEFLYYVGILILMLLGVIMCDELNDRFKRIPFGPIRVPILGNLHQLFFYDRLYTYKALTKLASVHGDKMKLYFGFVGSIVISGYERIQEVLRSDDWVGEQDDVWLLDRTKSRRNRAVTDNADSIRAWASARMYANQALRDYGFGKEHSLESVLTTKSSDLCGLVKYWKVENNKKLEMDNFFLPFALSINWTLVTGEVLTVEDSRLQELLKLIKTWEEITIESTRYLANWPILSEWAPKQIGFDRLVEVNQQILRFLQNLIQERRAQKEYNSSPKNLIDKFLLKIEEFNDVQGKKSQDVPFSDATLISVLFNVFFPSTLVLQSTLSFAMMYVSKCAEVQKQIRTEMQKVVVGQNKTLSVDQLEMMPYLTAVILEVYRLANVIPLEKRKILKTVRDGDTRVTQGMSLVFNYDSANSDPDMWKDPTSFKPERFLDHNGRIVNENKVLAVVAAKRLCIGELVNRPVLMHAIASLVQSFTFKLDSDNNTVTTKPDYGIINKPSRYEIVVD